MALSVLESGSSADAVRVFSLHGGLLKLVCDPDVESGGLVALLEDLSFQSCPDAVDGDPCILLKVRTSATPIRRPPAGRKAFDFNGVSGVQTGAALVVSVGGSTLSLQPRNGVAEARLTPAFLNLPSLLQRNFWAFGLMKLLRAWGWFVLHSACLVSADGRGVLLVAAPGSGKSTLAIGLIQRGWRYLSDDAVLLRRHAESIESLALRRHFYVDASARQRYRHVDPVGVADGEGGARHRLDIERNWPAQSVASCRPSVLLLPQIEDRARSRLEAVSPAEALAPLLRESGPQLFDQDAMPTHLGILQALLGQCRVFRLRSGRDLLLDPGAIESLIEA